MCISSDWFDVVFGSNEISSSPPLPAADVKDVARMMIRHCMKSQCLNTPVHFMSAAGRQVNTAIAQRRFSALPWLVDMDLKRQAVQTCEQDVNAWANEQARLLRARRFDFLDAQHIADEREDMGKSEQRALASCKRVLLAHLLKWTYQPEQREASWEKSITAERKQIRYVLRESPSLAARLQEARWLDMVLACAIAQVVTETGLDCFPPECPFSIQDEVLSTTWLPK